MGLDAQQNRVSKRATEKTARTGLAAYRLPFCFEAFFARWLPVALSVTAELCPALESPPRATAGPAPAPALANSALCFGIQKFSSRSLAEFAMKYLSCQLSSLTRPFHA